MFLQFRVSILFLVGVGVVGCATYKPLAHHDRSPTRGVSTSTMGSVRTGGLYRLPQAIPLVENESLTLRQVGLLSGGILQLPQTQELSPTLQADYAALANSAETVERPVLNSLESSDSETIQMLEEIFGDQNIDRVSNLLRNPADIRNLGSLAAREFGESDPRIYLRNVLLSLDDFYNVDSSWKRTGGSGDWGQSLAVTEDWNELIQLTEELFVQFRDRDPALVDDVTQVVDRLRRKQLSTNQPATTAKPNVTTTNRVLAMTQPAPVKTSTPRADAILIGLTRDGATDYFHLSLVDQSILGELPVRDGDFVFAVEASRTALAQSAGPTDDFYVPVAGIAGLTTPVLRSDRKELRDMLGLIQQSDLAADATMIIERQNGSLGRVDRFYLPIGSSGVHSPLEQTKRLLENRPVAPGDRIIFVSAGMSPVINQARMQNVQLIANKIEQTQRELSTRREQIQRSRLGYTASEVGEQVKHTAQQISRQIKR